MRPGFKPTILALALTALAAVAMAGAANQQARIELLKARAEKRAFDGAPPVIPHEVSPLSAGDCLDCHDSSDVEMPTISHRKLTNCTQCHLPQKPSGLSESPAPRDPPTETTFKGLAAPTGGERSYTGAPPMIPHSTLMRSNCLACHGPSGAQALRTPHPERQSCRQCHLSSAKLDQRNFLNDPPR